MLTLFMFTRPETSRVPAIDLQYKSERNTIFRFSFKKCFLINLLKTWLKTLIVNLERINNADEQSFLKITIYLHYQTICYNQLPGIFKKCRPDRFTLQKGASIGKVIIKFNL